MYVKERKAKWKERRKDRKNKEGREGGQINSFNNAKMRLGLASVVGLRDTQRLELRRITAEPYLAPGSTPTPPFTSSQSLSTKLSLSRLLAHSITHTHSRALHIHTRTRTHAHTHRHKPIGKLAGSYTLLPYRYFWPSLLAFISRRESWDRETSSAGTSGGEKIARDRPRQESAPWNKPPDGVLRFSHRLSLFLSLFPLPPHPSLSLSCASSQLPLSLAHSAPTAALPIYADRRSPYLENRYQGFGKDSEKL